MALPIVTGIAPREGTPGTRVTIRGENLGKSQSDVLGVVICGKNCSMTVEWVSSSKIICRTSIGIGRGEIIVLTRSGGTGSSTVSFTGLDQEKVGPLEKSAVWVDENEYVDQRLDRSQKASILSMRTDPLGLNSEDLSQKTQARMQLAELFVNGSPDPTDENFVPSWFLVERHGHTSFAKLKEGHAYMKRRANRNTNNAPLNHVKDSLPVFFEVHETLSGIYQKMQKNELGAGTANITDNLEAILNEASGNANTLFKTVLSCKDRADSIRNTLNVLQRFKFLFNLPLNIERNIQKKDYGIVINDYEKAKSLFSSTDIEVFKKVYCEVEKRIADFRARLKKEVEELPSPLTRQKMLIRYLLGLGDAGDPAWECLEHQHTWIQESMKDCKNKRLTEAGKYTQNSDDQRSVQVTKDYLEELTHIALSQIPEHWNLWQHYASGVILSETGEKTSDVENLKQAASKHTKDMKNLMKDTIMLFVNLIRAAFLPTTLHVEDERDMEEREEYGLWPDQVPIPATVLSECVRSTRRALSELSQLNLPQGALQPLKDVIHDFRVFCMSRFLTEATEDVKALKLKETWEVNNKGVTALPSQMNTLLVELLAIVKEVLQSLPGEEPVFARVAVQGKINQLLTALFMNCISCFERTSFLEDTEAEAVLQTGIPPLERRLVIGISNLAFMKRNYLQVTLEQFKQLGFPNVELTNQACEQAVTNLDIKLFEAYLEQRVEPLTAALEPGMYAGSFDWDECLKPTGVRPYIKLALMNVVGIHAEVYTICPDLVSRVLSEVIRALAEELLRLVQCITRIGVNGSLQARLDLEALQQSTLAFSTPESEKAFSDAMSTISPVSHNCARSNLDDLINRFKSNMIFQLRCFEASS